MYDSPTEMEKKTDEFQDKMKRFNDIVNSCIGDHVKSAVISPPELSKVPLESIIDLEGEDQEFYNEFNKAISEPSLEEVDDKPDAEFGHEDSYLGRKLDYLEVLMEN